MGGGVEGWRGGSGVADAVEQRPPTLQPRPFAPALGRPYQPRPFAQALGRPCQPQALGRPYQPRSFAQALGRP
jgi:hypothetical protein